jgi:hypothetical protein
LQLIAKPDRGLGLHDLQLIAGTIPEPHRCRAANSPAPRTSQAPRASVLTQIQDLAIVLAGGGQHLGLIVMFVGRRHAGVAEDRRSDADVLRIMNSDRGSG